MAGFSDSMDDQVLRYRIKGSGITGYNHYDNLWEYSKTDNLVVKMNDDYCLCPYKDQNIRVGSVPKYFQEVFRDFLRADESAEITMKLTETVPDKTRKLLPADIVICAKDVFRVRNKLKAIQKKINEFNKDPDNEDQIKFSMRKIPLNNKGGQGKKKDKEQTEEDANSLQDNYDSEIEEMSSTVNDNDNNNASQNEEQHAEVESIDTDEVDINSTGSSDETSKKRMKSDAEMLTDQPFTKQMKQITSCSSLQNMLEDFEIKDQEEAESTAENGDEKKTFNFRLLYLLVEIGVPVLRNIFDEQVKGDFEKHLKDNHQHQSKLDFLIHKNILNETQQELIQPKTGKPSSCNFDITLLALLLRNVCGFKDSKDPVWKNPDPSDITVEADICRLRLFRNEVLGHITTVYISENEFTKLWKEIKMVLIRLDSQYGNGDIESKIDAAETMPTDERYEKMKAEYEEYVRKWQEMDDIIEEGGEMIIEAVTVAVNRLKENYYQQKSK